jgi:catechol 2,3-dioxygenase-like lactoylglutathione lyase family enzyme
MKAKYKHTNIIARDRRALVQFYQDVLGCVFVPPERDLFGDWLDKGTGIEGAQCKGSHLRLPGYGPDGPTLEIYQYAHNEPKPPAAANREGIMHLAFEVDNVEEAMAEVLEKGGGKLGEMTSSEVEGAGLLTFVYLTDPEGNIIELQSWR